MNNCAYNIEILDIIRLKRENEEIETVKKVCYALSCRVEGESEFDCDGKNFSVKKGDILYIPKNADYSQRCRKEEIITFHFDTHSKMPDKVLVFNPENADKIIEIFENACKNWDERQKNYKLFCLSDLYKLLAITDFDFETDKKIPEIIVPSVDYINKNIFSTDFSIHKAVLKSHISNTYFNKLFRGIYGTNPIDYVNGTRIDKAKVLVDTNMYTRTQIANLCGFADVKYFYYVFKKYTGMTVGEYSKQSG